LKQFKEGGEKNHEALFLPVLIGCSRRRFGHLLVAGCMGKMGDCRRRRNLGHHEPFLPNVLLPKP
jgi:hypothetical protein